MDLRIDLISSVQNMQDLIFEILSLHEYTAKVKSKYAKFEHEFYLVFNIYARYHEKLEKSHDKKNV